MNKKCLLLIICAVLLAAALPAFPAQGKEKTIVSNASTQLADNAAQMAAGGTEEQITLSRRNNRYRLTDGDVLDLDFPFTPDFNQTITVLPDGYVSLRGIGGMHVGGDTIPEVRRSLQRVYAKILRNPVITVTLKDFEKPYFIVGGQVRRPGKFDLRGDTTVMEAVDIAGGFTDNAKHSQILLYRRVSNGWVEVRKLDLRDMLRGKNLNEDPHLRAGDMLFVPKSAVSKVRQFIPSATTGVNYNPILH
ncbi:MAG: polysaccharide export protein [Acidobacteriota bacterium]